VITELISDSPLVVNLIAVTPEVAGASHKSRCSFC
jgi:hypothetical protein